MERILIVDDEPNLRRSLAIGLRLEGFEVAVAESAADALAQLGASPFDLALVDMMMPGVHGLDLARAVRERHPDVRVLLTSAYHFSDRQLVLADCGAVGFIAKPYAIEDLARLLRSKLGASTPA